MAGQPFSKQQQLARGERRYTRKVASPKRWQSIIDAKRGPCRICGRAARWVEFHHVVGRGLGGGDVAENIVPLCSDCHRNVTVRDKEACAELRRNLTDAEYAYAVEALGEDRFEAAYPVEYRGA